MKSPAYIAGFLLGVGAGLLLLFFLFRYLRRKEGGAKRYDERQQLIRGRCYKTAFWVLSAYMLLNGAFVSLTGLVWAEPILSAFIGFCLAATVFVVLCIRRDAYFSLNERPGFYIRLFSVIAAVELVLSLLHVFHGDGFVTDGQLNTNSMGLVILAMYAVILPLLILRQRREKVDDE